MSNSPNLTFPQKHFLKTQFVLIFFSFFSWHILALTLQIPLINKELVHVLAADRWVCSLDVFLFTASVWEVESGNSSELQTEAISTATWRDCGGHAFWLFPSPALKSQWRRENTRASLQSSPWIFLLINHFYGCSPVTLPRWPRHKAVAAKATLLQV